MTDIDETDSAYHGAQCGSMRPHILSMQIFGGSGLKVPVGIISVSGATQMLAMASSNEALRYVSYPTQVCDVDFGGCFCVG
jgi:hypothetical protein